MDRSLNNRWRDGLLLALVSLLPSLAAAQSVTIPDEYSKLIKHSGEITVFVKASSTLIRNSVD